MTDNRSLDSHAQARITRRRFLKALGGLLLSAGSLYGYTRSVEPFLVAVEEIALAIRDLPGRLVGKRIAQISDIHMSQYMWPERLLTSIQRINELQPDWLMITGDFISGGIQYAELLVEPLRALAVPAYAVYGNHDYWGRVNGAVQRSLGETPVTLLRNEAMQLEAGLWLAGVDDQWSGRPDVRAALRDVPGAGADGGTTLLLSHAPDYFDTVIALDAPVAMQLSGHSHGGQVRLPTVTLGDDGARGWAPILPRYGRRYPIGLRTVGARQVYTNRGLGVWPVPYRFNCRPEITLFTLHSA